MNTTNRLWHVAAAVGLALLAVLLTTFYVTNYKRHVQHGEAQVTVLVAAKDIPTDTQGTDLLSGTWLTKESVPRRQVVPGAISSAAQLRGLIATEPTYAGEQVAARRFGTPAERGVRAQLKGTQRVVEVSANGDQVLAGTLRIGDHVDVVGAWSRENAGTQSAGSGISSSSSLSSIKRGDGLMVSRVFIRDALVLAVPTNAKGSGVGSTTGDVTVQLRMSDADSQKLEWMAAHGKDWRLEIRPPADATNSPRWHETGETLLKDGAGVR